MESKNFKIIIFNVGQGDHILVEFPNTKIIVIDLFFDPKITFKEEPPAITYINNNILNKNPNVCIEFLHFSHYDYDHIKGTEIFLKWLNSNVNVIMPHILYPGILYDKDTLDNFFKNNVKLNTTFNLSKIEHLLFDYFIDGDFELLVNSLSMGKFIEFDQDQKLKLEKILEEKSMNILVKRILGLLQEISFEKHNQLNKIKTRLSIIKSYLQDSQTNEKFVCANQIFNDINTSLDCEIEFLGPNLKEVNLLYMMELDRILNFALKGEGKKSSYDRNRLSSIIFIRPIANKDYIFSFLGDSLKAEINRALLDYGKPYKCVFVKASHHGAKNGTSESVWQKKIKHDLNAEILVSAKAEAYPNIKLATQIKKANRNAKLYSTNKYKEVINDLDINEKRINWDENLLNMIRKNAISSSSILKAKKEKKGVINKLFLGYEINYLVEKDGSITTDGVKKLVYP